MPRGTLEEYLENLEYPPNWKWIAYQVRIRDNYTCQRCGRKDLPLHVHHISGRSHEISNLETLCKACHFEEHPWLRAAYEARVGKDKGYLDFVPQVPEEFIELHNLQEELGNLKSKQKTLESKLSNGSYFLYRPPSLFWRFVEKIKPRNFCYLCAKKEKLTKYKERWICKSCKEKEVQREKEEAKRRTQKETEEIKEDIQRKEKERRRKEEDVERKFVVTEQESVGSAELQRQLELERQSR